MSFLIDTNIASAYLKGNAKVFSRFMQHTGGLYTSALVAGELFSWAFRANAPADRLESLVAMLADVPILEVDHDVARKFGEVRAVLLDQGRPKPGIDLFIACTALVHDLTVVTHNVADFQGIPELRIQDWLDS